MRKPERSALRFPLVKLITRLLLVCGFLLLVVCADIIASWPILQPSNAFAMALKNPNPPLSAPSWLTQPSSPGKKPNLNKSAPAPRATAPVNSPPHQWKVSMRPARLTLTNAAQRFVGSDGQLEVEIPANSFDATQLAQTPGGIQLYVTQVKPGAGSTDSGSVISFGVYEFQFFDGTGKPLSGVHLLHSFTVHLHLGPTQRLVWMGQPVYAQWNEVKGSATPPALPASNAGSAIATQATQLAVMPQLATTRPPSLIAAQGSKDGLDWSVQTSFTAPTNSTSTTARVQPSASQGGLAVQASTVGYNTQAPQATWGTPADFQVGLRLPLDDSSWPWRLPAFSRAQLFQRRGQ